MPLRLMYSKENNIFDVFKVTNRLLFATKDLGAQCNTYYVRTSCFVARLRGENTVRYSKLQRIFHVKSYYKLICIGLLQTRESPISHSLIYV